MATTNKLRMLVLKSLAERPQSGYDLIKGIREATGWKPSYGSTYPLLDCLGKQGIVTCREDGKRKVYTLTAAGKRELKEFRLQHSDMVERMREMQKVVMRIYGVENEPSLDYFASAFERGELPFKPILKHAMRLRKEVVRLEQQGLIEEHKEQIAKIIDEATRKLQKIQVH